MTIREPILAFSLGRDQQSAALSSDDKWGRRSPAGTAVDEVARLAADGEGLFKTVSDYAAMQAENVTEVNRLVSRIKATRKRHLEAIFEISADLIRAKELIGAGAFPPWLQAEFRWSERTANVYMKIAQRLEGQTAILASLGIGAAHAIGNTSQPAAKADDEPASAEPQVRREAPDQVIEDLPRFLPRRSGRTIAPTMASAVTAVDVCETIHDPRN